MARLELYKFRFRKRDLAHIPRGLVPLVIQAAVLADEVSLLLRMTIMCEPDDADRHRLDADIALKLELVRQLAAVLSKAWDAWTDERAEDARKEIKPKLPQEAMDSLVKITEYFSNPKNNADRIRNELTFHHRLDVVRESFRALPDHEVFSVYAGATLGNFRSSAAYVVLGRAMLKGLGHEPDRILWDDFWREILSLADHFKNLLFGQIAVLLDLMPTVKPKQTWVGGAPRIKRLSLTHFIADELETPDRDRRGRRRTESREHVLATVKMQCIRYTKARITCWPEDRVLYGIQASAVVQLLALWWKATLMCANAAGVSLEEDDANVVLHGYFVRRLAGELYEAWLALRNRRYLRLDLWSQHGLPDEAAVALRNLEAYFGGPGGEWLKSIRDEHSHHSDLDRLAAAFSSFTDDHEFSVSLCKGQAIARFDAVDRAGELAVFVPGRPTAIPGFNGGPDLEIAQVARWLKVLLVNQLEALVPEAPQIEDVEIHDVPRLEQLVLPYWIAP